VLPTPVTAVEASAEEESEAGPPQHLRLNINMLAKTSFLHQSKTQPALAIIACCVLRLIISAALHALLLFLHLPCRLSHAKPSDLAGGVLVNARPDKPPVQADVLAPAIWMVVAMRKKGRAASPYQTRDVFRMAITYNPGSAVLRKWNSSKKSALTDESSKTVCSYRIHGKLTK